MNLYSRGNLVTFNDLMTRPQGVINLTLEIVEECVKEKVLLMFLIIPCKSAFRGILGRSFLKKLDVMASLVNLKVTYQDMEGRPTPISPILKESKKVKELIHKDILAWLLGSKENSVNTSTFALDARKEEVRSARDGEFEFFQLDDNYM